MVCIKCVIILKEMGYHYFYFIRVLRKVILMLSYSIKRRQISCVVRAVMSVAN